MSLKQPQVYIVRGGFGEHLVGRMFVEHGWKEALLMEEADLVQFTGGEDINPALYGQHKHASVYFNQMRDDREVIAFNKALKLGIPMAGICRGAQLFCAMNGGILYQDVNNHCRTHNLLDRATGRILSTSSTHHQMMRPGSLIASGEAVGVATSHMSTRKEYMTKLDSNLFNIITVTDDEIDWEVLWFPKTRCLAFQGHPEYGRGHEECTSYYFELIKRYLEL